MQVTLPTMSPQQFAEHQNLIAQQQKAEGIIEYVAMMCDIEIPSEDEEEDGGLDE